MVGGREWLMCEYSSSVKLGMLILEGSVSNITDDSSTRTTTLAAEAMPLSEVAGSYELAFGQISSPQPATSRKRSLWDDVKGDFDPTSQTVSFNINAGQRNQRTIIYTDPK